MRFFSILTKVRIFVSVGIIMDSGIRQNAGTYGHACLEFFLSSIVIALFIRGIYEQRLRSREQVAG